MARASSIEKRTQKTSEINDSTLSHLIELLLGSSSSECNLEVDSSVLTRLSCLVQTDSYFADWISQEIPGWGTSPDQFKACRLSWEDFLRALMNFASSSELANCLRQAASQLHRLRTLQNRFGDELELCKREALYQLAYGLSHELNNPLANIATRADILLATCQRPDQRMMLEAIIDNASRGSDMLGDLMLIARPPELQLHPIDLVELGGQVQSRAGCWTGQRGITFEADWRPEGVVQMDSSMTNEILWALLRNAIEASPEGGSITLFAELEHPRLMIEIDDRGPGLSQEALACCCDPYYSGREAGRGLGMGLAKAKRLAVIHGGDIEITNRPTGGCRARAWIQVK